MRTCSAMVAILRDDESARSKFGVGVRNISRETIHVLPNIE